MKSIGLNLIIAELEAVLDGPILDQYGNRDEGGFNNHPNLPLIQMKIEKALSIARSLDSEND